MMVLTYEFMKCYDPDDNMNLQKRGNLKSHRNVEFEPMASVFALPN
jgi:hypothetical protein